MADFCKCFVVYFITPCFTVLRVYVYRYAGQNDQLVTASQCFLVISETWHLLNELTFGFDFLNVDRHEGKA